MPRLLCCVAVFIAVPAFAQKIFDTDKDNPGFASSILGKPADWSGDPKTMFEAHYAFPATAPDLSSAAWLTLDPRKAAEREKYYAAVLAYGLTSFQGDITSGCPKTSADWFHAPWMTFSFGSSIDDIESGRIGAGREPLCGLTEERPAPVGFLHKNQARRTQSWAVGQFNAPGGALLGKIFKNKDSVDLADTKFPNGTFIIKFLFTEATEAEVPYLKGSPTWQVNVYDKVDGTVRKTQGLRLAQIDFGIRDSRMDSTTGWVYGTFLYYADPGDADWKKNLVPVGLMWGNDPGVKDPAQYVEQALNPAIDSLRDSAKLFDLSKRQVFGWFDRVNGPIDNPASSCLSCHGTAQVHKDKAIKHFLTPALKQGSNTDDNRMLWFRNTKAGTPFTFTAAELNKLQQGNPNGARSSWTVDLMKDFVSTDYSLQLRMAIETSRAYAVEKSMKLISLKTSDGNALFDAPRVKKLRADLQKEKGRIERDGASP